MLSGMAPLRKECRIYLDVSFVISCRRSDIHVSSSFKLEKVSWYILALGLGLLVLDLDKEVLNLGRKVVKCWVISVFDTHKLLRRALTIYVVHCNSSCFLHVRVRMYGRSESESVRAVELTKRAPPRETRALSRAFLFRVYQSSSLFHPPRL